MTEVRRLPLAVTTESRTLLTKVRRISCLLGLFEARTIRFPRNFFIAGVFKAVGRTCLSDIVEVNGRAIACRLPTAGLFAGILARAWQQSIAHLILS